MMIVWLWLATCLVALMLYLRHVYSRFSRHGVKGFMPVPILGTTWRVLLRQHHISEDVKKMYQAFPGERFVGKFNFFTPVVLVRDLELVKKITIKDFEHFVDKHVLPSEDIDPLLGKTLFSLKGQKWKDMRSTLSPVFTSSKMREMLPLMMEVSDHMLHFVKKQIQASRVDYIDVDAKELMIRCTVDVIASCAFGLKVDSHAEPNNQFFSNGVSAVTTQPIKFFLSSYFPKLAKIFKMSILSENGRQFFKNMVMNTMQEREAKNIFRPDMIHMLIEAKKGNLSHEEKTTQDADAGFAVVEESAVLKKNNNEELTDVDFAAQAFTFFTAGFATVSTIMTFMLYELAINPDVQEKLYQEIKENDDKNCGKFDYTSIQHMTYMDMVVSEILRLWAPISALNRDCIKDYNMGRPNSQATEDYIIRKGEGVHLSLSGFHRDPKYFPNPDKFDPERFSEQNKHNIKPFTYMPFGAGPRNCIGSRFALCEVKVMMYQLLKVTEVSPCPKTPIPAKLCAESLFPTLKGGHTLRFKARSLK